VFILLIAVTNLALGFAAALALEHWRRPAWLRDLPHADSAPALQVCAGLEAILDQWRRDDPDGRRTASLAIFEIDQLGDLVESHGSELGEKVLAAVANALKGMVRKDRGFDAVTPFGGHRFAIFFGDAQPREALAATERLRQTLAASQLDWDADSLALTCSCGVTEFHPEDTTEDVVDRLEQAVHAARETGGNCTHIDEGEGPTPVEPPPIVIEPRTLQMKTGGDALDTEQVDEKDDGPAAEDPQADSL